MEIILNYSHLNISEKMTIKQLIEDEQLAAVNLIVVNGVLENEDYELKANDEVLAIDKHKLVDGEIIKRALFARNNSYLVTALKQTKVVILGCGGIGSNVARLLVQSGIEQLTLIDYDVVDPTNLNRQFYTYNQIGSYKIDCLGDNLQAINPNVKLTKLNVHLDKDNIASYTAGYDFVIDGFDTPLMKSLIVNSSGWHGSYLILANGMAGIKPASEIVTRKLTDDVYVCGDGSNGVKPRIGLMATQVTLVASQMANKIIEIINDREKNEPR